MEEDRTINWQQIRERLAAERGKTYWRSLEELAESDGFQEFLQEEFPQGASQWVDPVSRRRFLTLAAASLAFAGLSSCTRQPTETIVPYVDPPEEFIPGVPRYFATAMSLRGAAIGVLAESHLGRPTKLEGNKDHPASLGATDRITQASILDLYDPDRSHAVVNAGLISAWDAFFEELAVRLEAQRARQGAGVRLLTQTIASPTLLAQIESLLDELPEAKWHQYEPVSRDNVWDGARLAFGLALEPQYRFESADVIVSLDADFLDQGPGQVRYARDFASRRRLADGREAMNRLYAVEPTPSLTGAMADHRLAVPSREIEGVARALARQLGMDVQEADGSAAPASWIQAVARDLEKHRGASLVLAGDHQPPAVHALAHAMNEKLGNSGHTVVYTEPVGRNPRAGSLAELVDDMRRRRVEMLVILEANPVYDAPVDLDFTKNMSHVDFRVHLGLYNDETAELCHWHVPQAHYLESWGDARAFDGSVSLVQPLIEPLYEGKSPTELLAALLGQPGRSGYDAVRDYWSQRDPAPDFEAWWRAALHDGLVKETSHRAQTVSLRSDFSALLAAPAAARSGPEVVFRPDPTVFDGRFANNAWLQELPKPLTHLTWDNAALISPKLAEKLGLANEDVVEIRSGDRSLRAPVWIQAGQAEESITLHLGYGRTRSGRVGTAAGFNAYLLRTSGSPWSADGIEIRKTGERYPLATTQHHFRMDGRGLIREATLPEYRQNPHFAAETVEAPPRELTLYPPVTPGVYAWGMSINLNTCIGCSACVVACQSENNIPVVGKEQVAMGREMQWIRVDTYYEGDPDRPRAAHQPVPCMHCENAPCEPVCPVGATVHSPDGLNEMIYNRCVGTRYCSNNCPYKVRRFNFLLYSDYETPVKKLMHNPDVTVRSRGVMEKCTYCVQRINAARIEAEKQDRTVRDGEIVTACQQVCPVEAITFGDVDDPESRVSRLKAEPRNYAVLTDQGTRPRTSYLARLRNPNPDIQES